MSFAYLSSISRDRRQDIATGVVGGGRVPCLDFHFHLWLNWYIPFFGDYSGRRLRPWLIPDTNHDTSGVGIDRKVVGIVSLVIGVGVFLL
ncbi:hypothetical protein FRC03_002179 [Tulasnella sp. 419]|nr:hypothetical protein FRC03_002179 [Tulasnella sp. 419]